MKKRGEGVFNRRKRSRATLDFSPHPDLCGGKSKARREKGEDFHTPYFCTSGRKRWKKKGNAVLSSSMSRATSEGEWWQGEKGGRMFDTPCPSGEGRKKKAGSHLFVESLPL